MTNSVVENKEEKREERNIQMNQNLSEKLMGTPAFLKEQIGKVMRVEFLIGTNNFTDRIGILEDVGANYILLRSMECDNLIYCEISAIKFITISSSGWCGGMNNPMMNPFMMNNRYYPEMNNY